MKHIVIHQAKNDLQQKINPQEMLAIDGLKS